MRRIVLLGVVMSVAVVFASQKQIVNAEESKAKTAKLVNIVKNAGGEDGNEWWGVYNNNPCESGSTDKEAHSGKRSMYFKHIEPASDNDYNGGIVVGNKCNGMTGAEAYEFKSNTKYYFSFWLKGTGFPIGKIGKPLRTVSVGVRAYDKDGKRSDKKKKEEGLKMVPKEIVTINPDSSEFSGNKGFKVNDKWTYCQGYFVTGENTMRLGMQLTVYGHGGEIENGATFYVDDMYIGEQEPIAPDSKTTEKPVK